VTALIIAIVVVALVAVWVIGTYNRLVRSRNRVRNAWSHVDVQLKRRYDLVPNLVETVKGYAAHEASTLNAVIEARNAAQAAGSVDAQAAAEGGLTGALRHLFALAEAYPDLKASGNYRTLQTQLDEIEGDIAIARQIYNDTTLTYNNIVETIPTNLVAQLSNFASGAFFEVEDEGRSVPRVDL
jgi:LemA protein